MPEGLPLVSVITPVHDLIDKEKADQFNLLVSLLNLQTYPNFEHIVIDNASKDDTVQLLMDYKSKGYLQFYSEPDMGIFDAYNKGIMRAKGKYVTFLNCDDFIHQITSLTEIVGILEDNNADYTYGISNAIHPEGYVFQFVPAMYNIFQVMPCPLQAMVFKRSILVSEGFFDPKLKLAADYDLIMRVFMKEYGGILYDKNYVTYRLSNKPFTMPERVEAEYRQVYIKNFRNIYPLTNDIVDKMVHLSEFPQDLLEKLSEYFLEENRDDFFAACERMHKMREQAVNGVTETEEEVTDNLELENQEAEIEESSSNTNNPSQESTMQGNSSQHHTPPHHTPPPGFNR